MSEKSDLYAGYDGAFALPPGKALDICLELQRAILEHRLRPGTKLSEDEVGELFNASRTVVRQALQALTHSELVTTERNRGAFVAQPSIREAREVFETREVIEPRLAAMAAKRITKAELKQLKSHIKNEHDALKEGDKGKALALSGLFHIAISEIADQQVMTNIVRSLISRSSLIIALYWKRPDTTCETHSHNALMSALENHDAKLAAEIMQSHLVDLHSGLNLSEDTGDNLSLADIFKR